MGEADRAAVAAGDDVRGRPAHRAGRTGARRLQHGLQRGVQRHPLVLPPPPVRRLAAAPGRPPVDGGLGRLPRVQPALRPAGGQGGARRRSGPRAGLPPGPRRGRPGPAAARSAHRPLHPHPVRRSVGAADAPDRGGRGAAGGDGRLRHLRLPHRPVGGRLPGRHRQSSAAGGTGRRTGARPSSRPCRPIRRLCGPRPIAVGGDGAGADRGTDRRPRPPGHRPGRPDGAVEEPPAGILGLRRAPGAPAPPAGAGGLRGAGLPHPSGPPRVPRLPERGRVDGGPHQRAVGHTGLDAHRPRGGGRLPPVPGRADPLRRPAGQPGARRAQPGGQGGTAAQHPQRRAGPVTRGGRLRRAAGAARWRSTPSRCRAPPTVLAEALDMDAGERATRADAAAAHGPGPATVGLAGRPARRGRGQADQPAVSAATPVTRAESASHSSTARPRPGPGATRSAASRTSGALSSSATATATVADPARPTPRPGRRRRAGRPGRRRSSRPPTGPRPAGRITDPLSTARGGRSSSDRRPGWARSPVRSDLGGRRPSMPTPRPPAPCASAR